MAGVTLRTIAAEAQTSVATVSYVLSGRAQQMRISPERVVAIEAIARRLGYRRQVGSAPVRYRRTVSLLSSVGWGFLHMPQMLVAGIFNALESRDLWLEVGHLDSAAYRAGSLTDLCRVSRRVGLLLFWDLPTPPPWRAEVEAEGLPAVWLNTIEACNSIRPDDFNAGRRAAQVLLRLGHRRLAYAHLWCPPEARRIGRSHYSAHDRHAGFAAALAEQGLAELPGPILRADEDDRDPDHALAGARRFLSRSPRPTAVVCYSETDVVPLLRAARVLGLRVPEDLSLITCCTHLMTYGDLSVATMLIPNLQIAASAVELLDQLVAGEGVRLPERVLPFAFQAGGSIAPPTA